MTPRERLLAALNNEKPDHLPATVHSWMKYYLDNYLGGVDQYKAYELTGLDMVIYYVAYEGKGGMFLENRGMVETEHWRVSQETREKEKGVYATKIKIDTPEKNVNCWHSKQCSYHLDYRSAD